MGVDCPDFPKIHLMRPDTGPRWLVPKPGSRAFGKWYSLRCPELLTLPFGGAKTTKMLPRVFLRGHNSR